MRRAWAVFKREYLEVVKKKSFIIGTVVAPFFLSAVTMVPAMLALHGLGGKRVVVVDGTGKLRAVFAASSAKGLMGELTELKGGSPVKGVGMKGFDAGAVGRALDVDVEVVEAAGDLATASRPQLDRLANGARGPRRLDGVLVVPADAYDNPDAALTFYSRSATDFVTQERVAGIVNQAVSGARLAARGIQPGEAGKLLKRLPLDSVKVTKGGKQQRGGELNFIMGFVFVMLLMVPMMMYGQEVMRGIVQEKTDRVVEILVSSLTPMQLLGGKVMGLAAVGLTQVAVWTAMGVGVAALAGGAALALGVNVFSMFSLSIVPYFFLFYLLGYLIFVCIYAVGGAISNTEKEAQQILAPLMVVTMVPWFLAMPILQSPDSALAVALSLVPVFTPITMFMRLVVSEPPAWQIALSVLISVGTIWVMSWGTAKIFRVGILSYGKRPTLGQLLAWLRVA